MGFLGKVLSNAVSDGIGKGIQNAVGKAVENAVRPAADKLAGQAADHLNQAARSLEENAEATRTAVESAPASPAGGVAELGSALAGWATAMQGVAGQVAQNMKECPQCGEVVTNHVAGRPVFIRFGLGTLFEQHIYYLAERLLAGIVATAIGCCCTACLDAQHYSGHSSFDAGHCKVL